MPSPPKPWEVNNTTSTASVVTSPTTAASMTTSAPEIPSRTTLNDSTTSTLNTPARPASYSTTGYGTTGYGTTGYGSTGFGSTGYGSSYGSMGYGSTGYGSYGGYGMNRYGGSSYGGYGGYGSYGGYGGGYGMNRFGGGYGRMGGPGGPDEMSLTQKMEMGTRSTFEVVENIVGSFGGFAQMLDSTFMATHSSFMAMVGVAEQLGYLKNYLGQVFSLFALYRFAKRMLNKATGRLPTGKPMEMNFSEFENFERKTAAAAGPKMSRKPLVIFLLIVIGLPYMMHKLIKVISAKQQQQMALNGGLPGSQQQNPLAGIDPAKLEFARATYDFVSESQMELSLKKGDIVAIISKLDPNTNQPSQWWRGRLRDGTMGIFPANYVEIIQKGGPNNTNQSIKDATDALKEAVPAAIADSPHNEETKSTEVK